MNIKGMSSTLLLFSLILCCSSVIAKTVDIQNSVQIFEGILGDKDQYHFEVAPTQAISISIEQINADVKVALAEVVDGKELEIYQLSTPADTWLNELLYITADDCSQCIVKVLPRETIDQSGKYQLTFEKRESIDPTEKAIMELAAKAGIAWLKSETSNRDNNANLEVSQRNFEQAAKLSGSTTKQLSLNKRYTYLASQSAHYLLDFNLQKKHLLGLLNENSEINPAISIRAKLQLAYSKLSNNELNEVERDLKKLLNSFHVKKHELIRASTLQVLGKVAAEKRLLSKALSYFQQSLQLYQNQGAWRNLINLLGEIGWTYKHQGQLDLSLNFFLQALTISEQFNHTKSICELNVSIGYLYRIKGDINVANSYINSALETSDTFPHHFVDGRAKQEKARILMLMGDYEHAIDILNEALIAYQRLSSNKDIVNIEYFLSKTHTELENYSLALDYAQNVLENDLKIGVKDDIGNAYHQLANIHLGLKEYSKALHFQEQALDFFTDNEDTHTLAKAYSQLAEISFKNGNQVESNLYFQKARILYHQNENLLGLIDSEYRYAKTQSSIGNQSVTLKTLEKLVGLVETLQQSIHRGDLRRSYLALQQDISNLYIDTLHHLGKSNYEMLTIAERFKSRTLIDASTKKSERVHDSNEFEIRRLALNQELQSQLVNYASLESYSAKQEVVKRARYTAAQLQQLSVKENDSSIEVVKPIFTPEPLITPEKIRSIQSKLNDDTLILYFDTGKAASHMWSITQDDIEHFTLPNQNIIAKQVQSSLVTMNYAPSSNRFKRSKASKNLAYTLFHNVNIQWNNYKKLIIIPDGPLHAVPFSTLETSAGGSLLLEKLAISYVSYLNRSIAPKDNELLLDGNSTVLVVANPSMQKALSATKKSITPSNDGFQFTELPYTQFEADAIERSLANNVILLTRDSASKQNFLNQALKQFDILHFATHGISYSFTPSMSGLVLSNQNSPNNLLLAPEISQMYIPAKLVVLSGCKTASGKIVNGEGLMGLSRAFLEAGTNSVIASLWSVEDKVTAKLMESFYKYLIHEQLSAAKALQLAKLDVKNHRKKNGHRPWRAPYYWAGFVLNGLF